LIPWILVAASGCPSNNVGEGDTGFHVAVVDPADGSQEVVDAISPELGLNASASEQTCTTDTVSLVSSTPGSTVTGNIAYTLNFLDDGRKIQIDPEDPLLRGYWYQITVRSGVVGCTDQDGRVILPFASSFFVPE